MKHKINILIPIFIILVLIYVVRSVAGTRVQVETLRQGSMEDMVSTRGVVIQYETVLASDSEGVLEPLAQEGARVAVGQEVAAIYSGTVDTGLRNRLEQVKKKISQVEANQAKLYSFTGDISRLEQEITQQTAELVEKSQSGDMAAVSELRFVIEALCEKKAEISGVGQGGSVLEELQTQKAELEAQIGASHKRITSPASGVFSTTVDGLEALVTPYNMTELTPSAVDSLLEQGRGQEEQKGTACKVVKNFRYFIAVNLPADKLSTVKTGDSVSLRLYDLTNDNIDGSVFYISPQEEERCTVLLDCNQHIESLFKRRFVNLELVKNRYEGYRVSVKSLRTKEDVPGVYVRRDGMLKFIPVTILYNTQDVAIVESADADVPLRLYDEVIVEASSYEEGKLLS